MFSDRDYARYRRPYSGRAEPSMVKTLIIANVAIFVLQLLFDGRTGAFSSLIWLRVPELKQLQLWRLGTHMFAHGGFFHILLNMWGLYIFGKPLEQRVGGNRFLHIYFLSGIIGAVAWLLFNWGSSASLLGASGAVFGIIAAAAMTAPNLQYMLLIPPVPMKLKTMAVVFGAIEVISLLQQRGMQNGGSRIAHLAHLGGMLGGFVYMRWIYPRGKSVYHKRRNSFFQNLKHKIRRYFLEKSFQVKNNGGHGNHTDNTDSDYSSAEVDRILDKVGAKGLSSLTQRERHILEKARERLKGKH